MDEAWDEWQEVSYDPDDPYRADVRAVWTDDPDTVVVHDNVVVYDR